MTIQSWSGRTCAIGLSVLFVFQLTSASVALAAGAASPPIASPVCRVFPRTGIPDDAAIDALPDGTVWYADQAGTRLVRINPDRSMSPFVPTDGATGRLSGIAIGPDGNVWYTKDSANRIGHIPPGGGEGVEFEPPEPKSFPSDIVRGRDGQLWFHSPIRNYIGQLGRDGSVVVHRGPKAQNRDFTPIDMTVGPDGNLWTTDRGHNAIYRFDVATGEFRRFDIATPTAHPGAITTGADGNLWFTMSAARKVGRITPRGVITEFDLGIPDGGAPRGIVGTADGTIWVTTSGRHAVRILPDGRVQPFVCDGNLGTAIVGAGGAPWFFGGKQVLVVEDASAPRSPRSTVSAPVAGAPWPVAGPTPVAGSSPVKAITLREAIAGLPATKGRVVLQLTSHDPDCTYCIPANPVVDAIATRRPADATYWRVAYQPWGSAWKDPDVTAAGVKGLSTIVVFQDGREVDRVEGTVPEPELEQRLVGPH